MVPLDLRRLAGPVAISLLLAGMSPATAGSASAAWDGHLDLQWTMVRANKLEHGPVATAPRDRAVVVVPRNDSRGFAVRMMSARGGDLWAAKWLVGDGPIGRLVPEAVTVNAANRTVVVAGHGVCRSERARREGRGPIFLRAYTLGGSRRWTEWIGRCPSLSSGRVPPAFEVSGADSWGNHLVASFTRGPSGDAGRRSRTGHVVSYGLDGHVRWRTALSFHSDTEVVNHDVTANRRVVTTSGEVVRSDRRGTFVIGLSPRTGVLRWRDVTGGRTADEPECRQSVDSTGRAVYVTGPARTDRGVLERRTRSGEVLWRTHVPPCVTVTALRRGGALWTGIAWARPGRPIVFGRHLAGGRRAWHQEFALPESRWPAESAFAASDHAAVGTADLISRRTGGSAVYLWYWHWR